jgi:single-strand DNA-binding protein
VASLNKVYLMGNLTRDPDLRHTSSGAAICNVGLAINRRWTTPNGEQREDTCFVDVDVWGKQADICRNYLHRGSPLFVEGRLRLDQWDDQQTGRKRSRLCVTAERIQLIGGPSGQGGMQPQTQGFAAPQTQGFYPQQPGPPQQQQYAQPQPQAAPPPPFPADFPAPAPQPTPAPTTINPPPSTPVADGSIDDIPF